MDISDIYWTFRCNWFHRYFIGCTHREALDARNCQHQDFWCSLSCTEQCWTRKICDWDPNSLAVEIIYPRPLLPCACISDILFDNSLHLISHFIWYFRIPLTKKILKESHFIGYLRNFIKHLKYFCRECVVHPCTPPPLRSLLIAPIFFESAVCNLVRCSWLEPALEGDKDLVLSLIASLQNTPPIKTCCREPMFDIENRQWVSHGCRSWNFFLFRSFSLPYLPRNPPPINALFATLDSENEEAHICTTLIRAHTATNTCKNMHTRAHTCTHTRVCTCKYACI